MLPTTIRSPPAIGDYIPLAEYESQTPESFVDGKPVLHLHLKGAKASAPKSQSRNLAFFTTAGDEATASSANGGEESEPVVEQTVDLLVNSENLIIFSEKAEAGVSLPYPSISIHAVKQVESPREGYSSQALWMQLEFSDGGASDDDFNCVELTVIPPVSPESATESSPAKQLYEAIANCSNLHPDPNDEEDEDEEDNADRIIFEGSAEHEAIEGFSGVLRGAADGGLPPPMPGSGGWITAENVHEYFDEEGNWIGPAANGVEEAGDGQENDAAEELGEGAGRTRNRDELEGVDGVNGHAQDDDDQENKRPRVS